jgi:hypothetical protein
MICSTSSRMNVLRARSVPQTARADGGAFNSISVLAVDR